MPAALCRTFPPKEVILDATIQAHETTMTLYPPCCHKVGMQNSALPLGNVVSESKISHRSVLQTQML